MFAYNPLFSSSDTRRFLFFSIGFVAGSREVEEVPTFLFRNPISSRKEERLEAGDVSFFKPHTNPIHRHHSLMASLGSRLEDADEGLVHSDSDMSHRRAAVRRFRRST